MAIIGKDGVNYSYECTQLIKDLKSDLEEFGNETVRSYYMKQNGAKLYYDYQFHEDDVIGGSYDDLDMKSLLQYLKMQNEAI